MNHQDEQKQQQQEEQRPERTSSSSNKDDQAMAPRVPEPDEIPTSPKSPGPSAVTSSPLSSNATTGGAATLAAAAAAAATLSSSPTLDSPRAGLLMTTAASSRRPPAPSLSTQEAIEQMAAASVTQQQSSGGGAAAAGISRCSSELDVAHRSGGDGITGGAAEGSTSNTGPASPLKTNTAHVKRLTTQEAALLEDAYFMIPTLEMTELPRGGISIETQSVGRVQFGLPPETIKDSMQLGIEVPRVYIIPVERFCREMGPALGINLAEFEFPAYFNWFIRRKKCILVVDSPEAESNIRSVFEETLLGPWDFRQDDDPLKWNESDFDASFPQESRPDFYQEFRSFRIIKDAKGNIVMDDETNKPKELSVDMLLDFCHFEDNPEHRNASIGVPPPFKVVPPPEEKEAMEETTRKQAAFRNSEAAQASAISVPSSEGGGGDGAAAAASDDESMMSSGGLPDIPPPGPFTSGRFASTSMLSIQRANSTDEDDDVDGSGHPSSTRSKRRSSSLYSLRGFVSRGGCVQEQGGEGGRQGSSSTSGGVGASQWVYSRVKWLGNVATVWPTDATPEQIKERSVPRCEIFCMPGGAEYFVHDVNADNVIVGKMRFSGTVRPPDENTVHGFSSERVAAAIPAIPAPLRSEQSLSKAPPLKNIPPSFYPPSFGVTVLGNSHGFDKNGSTSGYVLWINGRGVMVDPPPYSSATLEREGIRPQLIIGVIITHCHADHDAGAFQKVLTGSRVSVITAPSIYKSFIRKYAALSGLKPSLLRHSHRFRPAIIGQALRFQGATFHFSFSLHTIPCLAFKVEWRNKSIVFTGDHLNHPTVMKEMQDDGILSQGRIKDLQLMPLQECDVLLHEAGAPPIHTPLTVLQALPEEVRKRLYVVHTATLPDDCGLRVAPTGTAGTIRLDDDSYDMLRSVDDSGDGDNQAARHRYSCLPKSHVNKNSKSQSDAAAAAATVAAAFAASSDEAIPIAESSSSDATEPATTAGVTAPRRPPLVVHRRADVSDAWFILNLLSNVPFFTSLSYVNTMEVLEIANVQVFAAGEIVLSAERRKHVLCVIWEGTCCAQERGEDASTHSTRRCVWHAGDWSGPKSLQPDVARSAEYQRDIVAVSAEGVKAIMLQMSALEGILRRGSKPYRKYLGPKESSTADKTKRKEAAEARARDTSLKDPSGTDDGDSPTINHSLKDPVMVVSLSDHVLEVLKNNSVLRSLPALQKRMLESIAEGPRFFKPQACLWHIGDAIENAFLIVSGTAVFGQPSKSPRVRSVAASSRGIAAVRQGSVSRRRSSTTAGSVVEITDGRFVEGDKAIREVPRDSEYGSLEMILEMRTARFEDESYDSGESGTASTNYDAQDRFANRMLARLYATRRYTSGLVFGRGCYLCDTSRMVSGDLVQNDGATHDSSSSLFVVDEPAHSSSVIAGPEGCAALVFPRTALVPFLDAHPGLLMSLQGTQAVV